MRTGKPLCLLACAVLGCVRAVSMMLLRLVYVVMILVVLSVPAAWAAQEPTSASYDFAPPEMIQAAPKRPLVQFGLGFVMGAPVGDFRDNVRLSAGLSGHLDFGLGRSPISIGVEGTYLWYGSESRKVPLVGFPDLAVGIDTSNDMGLLHGRVRAQRPQGRMRPYVDGLVGFNYISTSTSVEARETCIYTTNMTYCSDEGDSITNLDDLVVSLGAGAGVQIGLGAPPHPIRLDLSLRYLYGGQAEYLTKGDIRWQVNGPVVLQPRGSRTDMLLVDVGVSLGR